LVLGNNTVDDSLDRPTIADTLGAICISVLASECLRLGHSLNHGLPIPPGVTQAFPAIIFGGGGTIVGHKVQGRATTQDLATVDRPYSVIGTGLRNGGKVPIVFRTESCTLETGDVNLRLVKRCRASFDEEDLR
jgi:hypothetical protein